MSQVDLRSLGRVTSLSPFVALVIISVDLCLRPFDVPVNVLHDVRGNFVKLLNLKFTKCMAVMVAPFDFFVIKHRHGFPLNVLHRFNYVFGHLTVNDCVF